MNRPASSAVSVDVLTLRFNPVERQVEIAVAARQTEPYLGQLALPGVVLWEGERLDDAARRSVQMKLHMSLSALGQLAVFDEPTRDPRGATLSVAMWGIADGETNGNVSWYSLDAVPELAFDHNAIIDTCRPMLIEKLWRDLIFTRALTGPQFPVSTAVTITRSLTGVSPDRGNLNRRLASVPGLEVGHRRVVLGRGRPGTLWQWIDARHPADEETPSEGVEQN